MGSSLTFHGQDGDVVLGDRTITFVDTATSADPVEIPRSEIAAVELKAPTLLGYGRLLVSTRSGGQHSVQFARGDEEHFGNLEAIIRP